MCCVSLGCLWGIAWEELWARQWMKESFDNQGRRNIIQRTGRFRTVKSWRRCKLIQNLFQSPLPLLCLFGFCLLKALSELFLYNYCGQQEEPKEQVIKMGRKQCLGMRILSLKELKHSLEISNHSLALCLATRATGRIWNQSDLQGGKNWWV